MEESASLIQITFSIFSSSFNSRFDNFTFPLSSKFFFSITEIFATSTSIPVDSVMRFYQVFVEKRSVEIISEGSSALAGGN